MSHKKRQLDESKEKPKVRKKGKRKHSGKTFEANSWCIDLKPPDHREETSHYIKHVENAKEILQTTQFTLYLLLNDSQKHKEEDKKYYTRN